MFYTCFVMNKITIHIYVLQIYIKYKYIFVFMHIYIFRVNAQRFLIDGDVLMLITRGSQRY